MNKEFTKFNQIYALSTIATIYIIYIICGSLGGGFDEYSFFFRWKERFSDMVEMFFAVKNNNPYFASEAWHISFYPPFYYLVVSFLKYCHITNFYSWLFINIVLFLFICNRFAKNNGYKILSSYGVFCSLFFLSVPLYYSIDRGNLEAFCILLVFAAFAEKNRFLSSILIGLAASIKLVPIIFALYYLSKGNLKYLALAFFTFFLTSLLAFASFDANISLQISKFVSNLITWGQSSLIDPQMYSKYIGDKTDIMQSFTVDLFDAIRIIALKLRIYHSGDLPYFIYKLIWMILTLLTVLMLPLLKDSDKLLVLSILVVAITPLAYVYRLAYLFIFILYSMKETGKHTLMWIILFLMIPKPYLQIVYRVDINQILVPLVLTLILLKVVLEKYYEESIFNYWRQWICRR